MIVYWHAKLLRQHSLNYQDEEREHPVSGKGRESMQYYWMVGKEIIQYWAEEKKSIP